MAFVRSNPTKEVLGSHIHSKPYCKQSRPQEPDIFQLPRITHWNEPHFYSYIEKFKSTEIPGTALSKGLFKQGWTLKSSQGNFNFCKDTQEPVFADSICCSVVKNSWLQAVFSFHL